jgi:hypothetical protein
LVEAVGCYKCHYQQLPALVLHGNSLILDRACIHSIDKYGTKTATFEKDFKFRKKNFEIAFKFGGN